MGLMDAFNAEATTELKVGELYEMLQQAADAGKEKKKIWNTSERE